jgi:hypothetical protein
MLFPPTLCHNPTAGPNGNASRIKIMSEERANNDQRNNGRGGRRRYFRRRPATTGSSSGAPSKEPAFAKKPEGPREPVNDRAGRMGRRRRRSRNRSGPIVTPRVEPTAESIVNLEDYQPPSNVFVYTHVLRPDSRDSYEFRAEHFSKLGRRLEDYEIDLSLLFSDDQRAEADDEEHAPES